MEYGLVGLFVVCFIASTLYPLASEAFVVGFVLGGYDWVSVLCVATAGNALGSFSSYYLAYFCAPWLLARLSLKTRARIESITPRIQKLGFVYAFFVFLPVVGDVFALALGLARYHQRLALLGIALGKLARYSVLIMPLVGF